MYVRHSALRRCARIRSSVAIALILSVVPIKACATESPVVAGMLRLMEEFGFVDRDRLPMGVPYLPSATAVSPFGYPGLTGPGGAATPGFSQFGGTNPFPPMMGSGFPGLAQPGTGWSGVPWMNTLPGTAPGLPQGPGWRGAAGAPVAGLLDGIWELSRGGLVVIRADAARLYVSRDRFQDYLIRYDDSHFWWRPRDGSQFERYRYRMEEGRMVLADKDGNLLLLRRRR